MAEQDPLRVPPEVAAWARDVVEGKPTPPDLQIVPSGVGDFSYRVIPGTDISKIAPADGVRFDELGRELVSINQDREVREPRAKEGYFEFTDTFPGVMGIYRDEDHGNFKATAVPQRQLELDRPLIRQSLAERAGEVFTPRASVAFAYEGTLKTDDGTDLSDERTYQIVRHALLGAGISEEVVNKWLKKETVETMSTKALARVILDGVEVKGITITFPKRLEIDAVNKHKRIRVRRPRRKNIKLKKDNPDPSAK